MAYRYCTGVVAATSSLNSSCPGLSRASTSLKQRGTKDVEGRDEPGHDGGRSTRRSSMTLFAEISPAADERSARLAGIWLMLLLIFIFSFGDAVGKSTVGA